ncbi:NrfD/PsrC family molybdoenzyme membrane anchor subunit [Fimbriiglobus ruber]|uniref:Formate dehydrogenase O putative subunit n=1 Tax=Fimbriiglobus ruber TaxID=1908690 RepID=A0A225DNH4_9BACT|nr:NrfD/PsrC family molybdoenzyme membrane anchor subunit [Fimbriiglobus ruber]OWK42932.1 Formate dehydrogenase O putative subunit [Fimbriiglobus ruber]
MAHTHAPPTSQAGYVDRVVTKPPDWHSLVVWDVFFNGVTTGLFLAAAVADLAMPDVFGGVARIAYMVALVALTVDLLCLVLDLGDPLRFHHMLRVFKPTSPMSLGTWCLTAYSGPLTVIVGLDLLIWLDWLPETATVVLLRKIVIATGLLPALGSSVYKGVLFSTSSQPGWKDARWFGAYLTLSAVVIGTALLLIIATWAGYGEAEALLRVGLGVLLVFGLLPLGLLMAELKPTLMHKLTATERGQNTLLVIGGGVILPLIMLLLLRDRYSMTFAALFVLMGAWVVRHVVVMLPQPRH